MKKIFIVSVFIFTGLIFAQSTWEALPSHPEGSGFTGLVVNQNGDLFATTGSFNYPSTIGGVSRSTDSGTTWVKVFPCYIARTIEITSDGNLFASIWDYPNANEGIYRSIDNGTTWNHVYIPANANEHYFSIKDAGGGIMYAGARYGLMVSFDSGLSWGYDASFPVGESWVWDVESVPNGAVVAASAIGVYSKTLLNWELVQGITAGDTVNCLASPLPSGLYNSDNIINDKIFGGSQKGFIYSAIANPLGVFAVVYLSLVYKILAIYNLHNQIIFASRVDNARDGIAGDTSSAGVITSYDGTSWTFDNEGLPANPVVDVFASNNISRGNITVYAGTFENSSDGAKIYKKQYSVVTAVNRSDSHLADYILDQNYPNPFNPATKISFSIPEESFVRLEIYNSLGEKVSTLVSKEMNPGNYSFEWNAENYSSGVYFYRIKAGDFTAVKKLVLLK